MGNRRARYHLRAQLVPGPDLAERAESLARFCREHDVEEAVLFVAAEEWNDGFLSDHELEQWREAIRACKEILEGAGIAVSLNPWYTVLHLDRGRHMPSGWSFTPMVSPSGRVAKAVASIACPNWRRYITNLYRQLSELGFRVVWIEDDFRYHNHSPLDWGGDFSSAMLGRFSAKVGREVSREELVQAILKPGDPHPWRALWLETWREVQLEAAAAIRAAVLEASPKTLLGLMSSHPSNHSIEGRDWDRLFHTLSNEGRVVHRPHFASYRDAAGQALVRSSFLLDCQKTLRPPSLQFEVTPEIENFPMGPYSKSDVITFGQMALAQVHGADAQMLDLFSFTCHCPEEEPWVGELLDRARPGLDSLAALFSPEMQTAGVGILWRPDAALHARTSEGKDMLELFVPLTPAAELLQSLGVAVQARPGSVNCLWGQVAWAYTDQEIEAILSGSVWLDAEATAILQWRGFGEHLPVYHQHWWYREDMSYSLEHPASDATGLAEHVWLSVNAFQRVARQECKGAAQKWTQLCDARGNELGSGLALWRNELGGLVACCAWPLATGLEAYNLSFQRQVLVQRLVKALAASGPCPTMAAGAPYTFPIDMSAGSLRRLAAFNASLDPQKPALHIYGARELLDCRLVSLQGGAQPARVSTRSEDEELIVFAEEPVPLCGVLVLTVA
jgi:hypothetical protein